MRRIQRKPRPAKRRKRRQFMIKEGEFEFELMGDDHSLQEWM